MTDMNPSSKRPGGGKDDMNFVVGVSASKGQETITARKAGGIRDMKLPVSPVKVPVKEALQNLAKAINLALEENFLETPLEHVYRVARVRGSTVQILHTDYMGLGEGIMANVGRAAKSFQLTLRGPDPASPEGKAWYEKHGGGTIRGLIDLLGRKLNLIQEFEDKVEDYVYQMLDRLEAANMIVGWCRDEWTIETTAVGLDVILTPRSAESNATP